MIIEILYFAGCPHYEQTRARVERIRDELAVDADIELTEVLDGEMARTIRFLGSPTVRVDGADVEPGAERRHDYALACRMYRTGAGASPQPDEQWLRRAIGGAAP